MDHWRKHPAVFWLLSLPPTLWLLLFFLAPLALIWLYSFGHKEGLVEIVISWTPDNYIRTLQPLYLQIFLKSFWFAGLTTALCLAVGLPVALAITFAPGKWKGLLLVLVILPFWTNLLIRTYALIAVLRTRGYLNNGMEYLWDGADGLLRWSGSAASTCWASRSSSPSAVAVQQLRRRFRPGLRVPALHGAAALCLARPHGQARMIEASLDLGAGQLRSFLFAIVVPLSEGGDLSRA